MDDNLWALSLDNVSYRKVLSGLNLQWQYGQLIGLIGPNGVGKSTLLRMLAGVWRPTQGHVCLEGKPLHALTARQRAKHVAYLPQQMPETAVFTVRQYVEMGRYAYRTAWKGLGPDSREAVEKAIDALDLSSYSDVYLDHLSGGERQRAGMARCIAQGSRIILLDEPISNLDLYYQVDILHRLEELAKAGYLIVAAIHNLELAARYCTALVLLNKGRVYAHSSPEQVLTEQALRDVFQVSAKTYTDPYSGFLRLSHQA